MIGRSALAPSPLAIAPVAIGLGALAALLALTAPDPTPVVAAGAALALAAAILQVPLRGVLSFALVAAVLPFAVVPVRVVFSPTLIDVVLTALLAAWTTVALARRAQLVRTPIDSLLLAFIGLAVLSLVAGTAVADLPPERLRLFLKLLNSLLFFFGVTQVVKSAADLIHAWRTVVMGGAAAAAIALTLYALPREAAATFLESLAPLGYPTGPEVIRTIAGTDTVRATGTSVDPNVLGALLMIALLLATAGLLAGRPTLPRWLLGASSAGMAVALALTYSRAAWVGLAVGLAYLGVFVHRRLLLAVALLGGAMAATAPGQTLLARLTSGLGLRDQATLLRLDEYRTALALIADYPVLGVGFGEAPRVDLHVGVSNLYLLVAEHIGIAGLALLLIILVVLAATAFRPDRASPDHGLRPGLQAAFLAALVTGLFDQYFFSLPLPHMVALFWMVAALLLASARVDFGETPLGTCTGATSKEPSPKNPANEGSSP